MFKQGVPQGSVLSPLLFAIFTSDLPEQCKHSNVEVYADDVITEQSAVATAQAEVEISEDLSAIKRWSDRWLLPLNPSKCETMTFTPATRECSRQSQIHIDNVRISSPEVVTYLGVKFDKMLHFHNHVDAVCSKVKVKARVKAIGRLSGATWGPSTDDLRVLYKSYVLPVITYGLPAWGPILSNTSYNKLDRALRSAAAAITSMHRTSPREALHIEAKIPTARQLVETSTWAAHEKSIRLPHSNSRYSAATDSGPKI